MLIVLLLFGILPAAALGGISVLVALVYLRGGARVGLPLLLLLGLAGTLRMGGEVAIPAVLFSVLLIVAAQQTWSLSRTIWTSFGVLSCMSLVYWIALFVLLGETEIAVPIHAMVAEMGANLQEGARNMGGSELTAAAAARDMVASISWAIAALPGFSVGSDFLVCWWGTLLLFLTRRPLWSREEFLYWQLPWPLIWVLVLSGGALLAAAKEMAGPVPVRLLEIFGTSGIALSAIWFLVQGFLVGLVALERWRVPRWLGVPGLVLLWQPLLLLGLVEIWVDLRGRMRTAIEQGPPEEH